VHKCIRVDRKLFFFFFFFLVRVDETSVHVEAITRPCGREKKKEKDFSCLQIFFSHVRVDATWMLPASA
jgi:hypothetical protein